MRLQDFKSCENFSAFIKDANVLHGADSSFEANRPSANQEIPRI